MGKIWRNYKLPISAVMLIAGMLLLFFSTYYLMFYRQQPDFVKNITEPLGNWNYWVFLLGLVLAAAGAWYIYDTLRKLREFFEYLHSDSKATFRNNLADLMYLAEHLGDRYVEMVEEKKREWKIK